MLSLMVCTFLDIKMDNIQTDIYCKPIHIGPFVNFYNQISSRLKSAWIKALFHQTRIIRSANYAFQQQVKHVETLKSCNSQPEYVSNLIINRLAWYINNSCKKNDNSDDTKVIWIHFLYLGKIGEQLSKSLN